MGGAGSAGRVTIKTVEKDRKDLLEKDLEVETKRR